MATTLAFPYNGLLLLHGKRPANVEAHDDVTMQLHGHISEVEAPTVQLRLDAVATDSVNEVFRKSGLLFLMGSVFLRFAAVVVAAALLLLLAPDFRLLAFLPEGVEFLA